MDVVLVSGSLPQNLPWKPPSPQRLYPLDFTKSQNFINMAYFLCGKLDFSFARQLPL
jgi:hypothetical protein